MFAGREDPGPQPLAERGVCPFWVEGPGETLIQSQGGQGKWESGEGVAAGYLVCPPTAPPEAPQVVASTVGLVASPALQTAGPPRPPSAGSHGGSVTRFLCAPQEPAGRT